jgi:hypothetical protein
LDGDKKPTSATQPLDDHPFVTGPDSWDHMYLQNTRNRALGVEDLSVTLTLNGGPTYTFVEDDGSFSVPGRQSYSLDSLIEERRECVFKTAYCGSADLNFCDPTPDTTVCANGNVGIENTISDVTFDDFPKSILEAIWDIGQPGLSKFNPMDNVGNNSGCSLAVAHYMSTYSANIHHGCNETSPDTSGICLVDVLLVDKR